MYTGEETLKHLKSYIWGLVYSLEHIENSEITGFLIGDDFDMWVASKFGVRTPTAGWANIITAIAFGVPASKINQPDFNWGEFDKNATKHEHYKSINMFFDLFDEYHEYWLKKEEKVVVSSKGDHNNFPVIDYRLPE